MICLQDCLVLLFTLVCCIKCGLALACPGQPCCNGCGVQHRAKHNEPMVDHRDHRSSQHPLPKAWCATATHTCKLFDLNGLIATAQASRPPQRPHTHVRPTPPAARTLLINHVCQWEALPASASNNNNSSSCCNNRPAHHPPASCCAANSPGSRPERPRCHSSMACKEHTLQELL